MYCYAGNNPVRYTDPDGREPIDIVQGALDAAGFIPVIGDFLDLGNGCISLVRGDYIDAACSFISIVPIVGDAIGKSGKGIKYASKAAKLAKKADKVGDVGKVVDKTNDLRKTSKVLNKADDIGRASKKSFRPKTRGANIRDRKQIESVAKKFNIDRRDFGDFIEDWKRSEGLGPSDNFTYKELEQKAKEFIEWMEK